MDGLAAIRTANSSLNKAEMVDLAQAFIGCTTWMLTQTFQPRLLNEDRWPQFTQLKIPDIQPQALTRHKGRGEERFPTQPRRSAFEN